MRRLIALWLPAFVGLASLSQAAYACVVPKQLDLGSLANAGVVLRAKIVSYEAIFRPKDYVGRRELRESSVNNVNCNPWKVCRIALSLALA